MKVHLFRTMQDHLINQCYLVSEDTFGILIDPSWNYRLIDQYLHDQNIEPRALLLTHSHTDHTDLAAQFADAYSIPVYMSRAEINYYGFKCPNLRSFNHLETIKAGPLVIQPILTPGHTAGSTCFLIEEDLFTGDTIFMEGIGICTLEGSDVNQMYDSVQHIKKTMAATTRFWPGHSFGYPAGKDLTFILEYNLYFQLDDRQQFTNFRMRKGQSSKFDYK